jgi:hypothetical protein
MNQRVCIWAFITNAPSSPHRSRMVLRMHPTRTYCRTTSGVKICRDRELQVVTMPRALQTTRLFDRCSLPYRSHSIAPPTRKSFGHLRRSISRFEEGVITTSERRFGFDEVGIAASCRISNPRKRHETKYPWGFMLAGQNTCATEHRRKQNCKDLVKIIQACLICVPCAHDLRSHVILWNTWHLSDKHAVGSGSSQRSCPVHSYS